MPTCWMMCGVPGSGKSTWIENNGFNWKNTVLISTDNIIEERAKAKNKTYSDVFKKEIKSATSEMNAQLKKAILAKKNIVWDQTNVVASARRKKLAELPDDYTKVAVYFPTPDPQELERRLKSRPGKTIPYNVVMGMVSQLEIPTIEEGFEEVITANQ